MRALQQAYVDVKASAFDHVTWRWGCRRDRDVAWGREEAAAQRHKLRWGGQLGMRFEPDFSNVQNIPFEAETRTRP
jgi:hypothetical protein